MSDPVLAPSVDFPRLLFQLLPGIYRDKDAKGELQRFLEIISMPLGELEVSIAQLYEDLFLGNCREPFIALLGALIGVEADPTLPERAQRAEVEEAFAFYRSKGLHDPIARFAEQVTRWRTTLVDFSQKVAQVPFVSDLDPVIPYRNQPVGEAPAGSGNFFFRAGQTRQPLFDRITGRPMTRQALAGHEMEYAGMEGRFTIQDRGFDLFSPETTPAFAAVTADLTDFAVPKTSAGAALTILPNQVAIDPELGRFKMLSPILLAGNIRVDFQVLVPASVTRQTFNLRDASQVTRLNRSDDTAPHTLDLRRPRKPTDRVGRYHFDHLGFFFTFGERVSNQRPNALPPGSQSGNFTFDGRLLGVGDAAGVALQLQDGIDGAPLTRRKLEAVAEYCGTTRGFTVRVSGVDLCSPDFQPAVALRAADLSDFANPKTPAGAPMILAPTEMAVDPQLGRLKLDLAALGITAEQVRVDYLLAPARNRLGGDPDAIDAGVDGLFGFDPGGKMILLRDGEDGTPISVKRRLGAALSAFHGKKRGWTVYRNGVDVSGLLLQAEEKALEDPATPVTPGRLAIDLDRGRFKFPAGFFSPDDRITVDYSDEDTAGEAQLLASFSQRSPNLLPAGVIPVLIDTRLPRVDPAVLE